MYVFLKRVWEQHRIDSVSHVLCHKQTVHMRHVINREQRLIGARFGGGTGCASDLVEKATHDLMRQGE